MTLPGDPPAVRARALQRGLRSRGTFQLVLGGAALVFAVVAATSGAEWWTVAIGAVGGLLLIASGAIAWRVAERRMSRLATPDGWADAGPPHRGDASPMPRAGEPDLSGGRGSV